MWMRLFFFFKQKTAYDVRISDWSSDVCSSDLWELYKKPKALAMVEVMLGARGDPELSERLSRVGRTRQLIERQLLGEEFKEMGDRKSVVEGTSVSGGVDLGGRR